MNWKEVIAKAMSRNGLTQMELAGQARCSQSVISDLARGVTQDPRFSVGQKLLELATSRPRRSSKRHTAAVEG